MVMYLLSRIDKGIFTTRLLQIKLNFKNYSKRPYQVCRCACCCTTRPHSQGVRTCKDFSNGRCSLYTATNFQGHELSHISKYFLPHVCGSPDLTFSSLLY